MGIKRYYNGEGNEDQSQYIAGVPLADLTDEQYAALPDWLQKQVDGSHLYRKSESATETKKTATKRKPAAKKKSTPPKPQTQPKPQEAPVAPEQPVEAPQAGEE